MMLGIIFSITIIIGGYWMLLLAEHHNPVKFLDRIFTIKVLSRSPYYLFFYVLAYAFIVNALTAFALAPVIIIDRTFTHYNVFVGLIPFGIYLFCFGVYLLILNKKNHVH